MLIIGSLWMKIVGLEVGVYEGVGLNERED